MARTAGLDVMLLIVQSSDLCQILSLEWLPGFIPPVVLLKDVKVVARIVFFVWISLFGRKGKLLFRFLPSGEGR